jgi:hypothetical protein
MVNGAVVASLWPQAATNPKFKADDGNKTNAASATGNALVSKASSAPAPASTASAAPADGGMTKSYVSGFQDTILKSRKHGDVLVHPSSVLYGLTAIPAKVLCYAHAVTTGRTYVRTLTVCPPSCLLLFGRGTVDHARGLVTGEGWEVRVQAVAAVLMNKLGTAIERWLKYAMEAGTGAGENSGPDSGSAAGQAGRREEDVGVVDAAAAVLEDDVGWGIVPAKGYNKQISAGEVVWDPNSRPRTGGAMVGLSKGAYGSGAPPRAAHAAGGPRVPQSQPQSQSHQQAFARDRDGGGRGGRGGSRVGRGDSREFHPAQREAGRPPHEQGQGQGQGREPRPAYGQGREHVPSSVARTAAVSAPAPGPAPGQGPAPASVPAAAKPTQAPAPVQAQGQAPPQPAPREGAVQPRPGQAFVQPAPAPRGGRGARGDAGPGGDSGRDGGQRGQGRRGGRGGAQ